MAPRGRPARDDRSSVQPKAGDCVRPANDCPWPPNQLPSGGVTRRASGKKPGRVGGGRFQRRGTEVIHACGSSHVESVSIVLGGPSGEPRELPRTRRKCRHREPNDERRRGRERRRAFLWDIVLLSGRPARPRRSRSPARTGTRPVRSPASPPRATPRQEAEDEVVAGEVEGAAQDRVGLGLPVPAARDGEPKLVSATPGQKHLAVNNIAPSVARVVPNLSQTRLGPLASVRRALETLRLMATSRLEFRLLGPLTVTVDGATDRGRRPQAASAARAAAAGAPTASSYASG